MKWPARFLALVLFGFSAPAPAAEGEPCRTITSAGNEFSVCTLDLRRYRLKLFWREPGGEAYGSFDRLRRSPDGARVAVAMNAGMYHSDLSPVGLYVENGQELKRINTQNGPGNFHMKPNGVFYVSGREAGVLETGRYLRLKPKADFATQSGPMLVIDGQIHPKFSEAGISRKIRNGVGIRDGRTVVFAISNAPVTFGEFAHLFRDELGCANALFLDGTISSLYAPSLGRTGVSLLPLGPIVAAVPEP